MGAHQGASASEHPMWRKGHCRLVGVAGAWAVGGKGAEGSLGVQA